MSRKLYVISFVFFILGLSLIGLYFYFDREVAELKDINVTYNNYKDYMLTLDVSGDSDNLYCTVSKEYNKKEMKFKKVVNKKCLYEVKDSGSYHVYLKSKNKIKEYKINKVLDIAIEKDTYFLAKNDTSKIKYNVIELGKNDILLKSSNNNVASISNNIMNSNVKGNAKVIISNGDIKKEISVVVTNLINKMPEEFNYNKKNLPCNNYSDDEAELLDKILYDRVEEAGNGTRAGVVAAVRFLTLEFPYKIKYFSENGRMANYSGGKKVDGEGRYYHKGLYLSYEKTKDIKYSLKGPAPWGCSIYSNPSKGNRQNGLDCSGFTTWVVYNGGFDIEDLGAYGGSKNYKNLNDVGEEHKLTKELALSNRIKAGDLLGEVSVSEGHSAIVVGIDKDYYYIGESLWISPYGVNINKYKKEELHKYFETVNLMDSFYKNDGNYTSMWY